MSIHKAVISLHFCLCDTGVACDQYLSWYWYPHPAFFSFLAHFRFVKVILMPFFIPDFMTPTLLPLSGPEVAQNRKVTLINNTVQKNKNLRSKLFSIKSAHISGNIHCLKREAITMIQANSHIMVFRWSITTGRCVVTLTKLSLLSYTFSDFIWT